MNMDFKIQAPFEPAGDQPQAIAKLAEGVLKKHKGDQLVRGARRVVGSLGTVHGRLVD